jgi:hypothetical protein
LRLLSNFDAPPFANTGRKRATARSLLRKEGYPAY